MESDHLTINDKRLTGPVILKVACPDPIGLGQDEFFFDQK